MDYRHIIIVIVIKKGRIGDGVATYVCNHLLATRIAEHA